MYAPKQSVAGEGCPCCGRLNCTALRSRLLDLEHRIAELEEENARLTASANSFADLADRLNQQLQHAAGAVVRPSWDRRSKPRDQ